MRTALEGTGDTVNAADSSRPGGSALVQSVLGPQVPTGGQLVGLREGRMPGFVSPAAGVLFSGSSQLVVNDKPQFGTSTVGGNGSIPAPKSLQDPGVSRSGIPKSGHVQHGFLGPVLSGSALAVGSGQVDVRESAAVDVGSTVGLGSVSGRQVGRTGSESATFASGIPVPPEQEWSSLRFKQGLSHCTFALWQ